MDAVTINDTKNSGIHVEEAIMCLYKDRPCFVHTMCIHLFVMCAFRAVHLGQHDIPFGQYIYTYRNDNDWDAKMAGCKSYQPDTFCKF